MLTNLLIALVITILGIIFYWQKEKTSFLGSAKSRWLLFVVVFVVTGFLTGYLLESALGRRIFQFAIGGAIIFYWSAISGWFQKKP